VYRVLEAFLLNATLIFTFNNNNNNDKTHKMLQKKTEKCTAQKILVHTVAENWSKVTAVQPLYVLRFCCKKSYCVTTGWLKSHVSSP